MNDAEEPRRWELTLIEKIVGTVLIGLLGWMAFTLQQMTIDVAVIKSELAKGDRDRFSAAEGKALTERVQRIEDQITTMEERKDR